MKTNYTLFIICLLFILKNNHAQFETNVEALQEFATRQSEIYWQKKAEAIEFAQKAGIPVKYESGGTVYELQYIDEFGLPRYYKTSNANSAATISTDQVHPGGSAGLNLDGDGDILYQWDEGNVYTGHEEFGGRAINFDFTAISQHSTHVAGTLVAEGIVPEAKGMAFASILVTHDWNDDVSEMANMAAGSDYMISNHSYGTACGWEQDNAGNWVWYGNSAISSVEDYKFGFYDDYAAAFDEVASDAHYYLICVAAGNDRNDSGPGGTSNPPGDGPYDCIWPPAVAKNVLTVGAVNNILGGYTGPSSVVMSSFSSWGPADDGRIKPDIVANGVGLYSTDTYSGGYYSSDGTSMATPSVTGSCGLLQQHYENLNGTGNFLRSATLKALVIHTADEAGNFDGPDYQYGWGLMNTRKAAEMITLDQTNDVIRELVVTYDFSYTTTIRANDLGEPFKVTIVWTDAPGTPVAESLDPPDIMLAADLDLTVSDGVTTYYPWKLDKNNPTNPATNYGKNYVDNVEQVYISQPLPLALYTVHVEISGYFPIMPFSMIISGIDECDYNIVLQDETVASGETFFEEASNTITAAGDGHYFIVEGIGDCTLKAGSSINLLPGFHSNTGSIFHGYIGPCNSDVVSK